MPGRDLDLSRRWCSVSGPRAPCTGGHPSASLPGWGLQLALNPQAVAAGGFPGALVTGGKLENAPPQGRGVRCFWLKIDAFLLEAQGTGPFFDGANRNSKCANEGGRWDVACGEGRERLGGGLRVGTWVRVRLSERSLSRGEAGRAFPRVGCVGQGARGAWKQSRRKGSAGPHSMVAWGTIQVTQRLIF